MKVTCSIEINAPAKKVYDIFMDIEKLPERVDQITKVEIIYSEKAPHWIETRTIFGKEATEEMWTTEKTVGKSWTVEAESHGTHYITNHMLSESEGVTTMTLEFSGQAQSLGAKLMTPLAAIMSRSVKKMLMADMQALKEAAEAA